MGLDLRWAATPPMGFNTWNKFAGQIDQDLIVETMDAMIAQGLTGAGYRYLNIDDGWMAPARDAEGRLRPDPDRFSGGIRPLAVRAHAHDMKLGIYSCCGTQTCMGLPASFGYETIDALTFAEWEIDYLKQDWCHVPFDEAFPGMTHREVTQILYGRIADSLAATGRPMVLSMCNWGDGEPWTWARGVAHLWRTTGDIEDSFAHARGQWTLDVVSIFKRNAPLAEYAGPGGWNDPDMLEVGNGGMSDVEYRSHFALWCMMAAPLLIGTDVRALADDTRAILLNRRLIAVNQDPLGEQARVTEIDADLYRLDKRLDDGDRAMALFNAGDRPARAPVDWSLMSGTGAPRVEDLFTGRSRTVSGRDVIDVAPHATEVWRIHP